MPGEISIGEPGRLVARLIQSAPKHDVHRDALARDNWLRVDSVVYRVGFVAHDFDAQPYALVANKDIRPVNQFLHFRLRLTTERAAEDVGKIGSLTAQGFFLGSA